jgi:endo-1,3-1,4-beta-glycanase ExoK
MFRLQIFLLSLAWWAGSAWSATTCVGAEFYSKASVRYGRWEFRMLAAAKPGTVSSFFTYYNESYRTKEGEPWREIDIEVLGNKPKGFQSNLITLVPPDTVTAQSSRFHITEDVSTGFHTYVMDWAPDSVVWRLDGKTIRKVATTNTTLAGEQVSIMQDKNQSYRMNLWASNQTSWVGTLDLGTLPIYQVVNWMRYSSYTPGAGDGGSDFTFAWLDDFAQIDTVRWARGNWTFENNLAQFDASNIVAKDGYLVLALTRPGEEGVLTEFVKDPAGDAYGSTSVRGARRDRSLRAFGTANGIRIEGGEPGIETAVRDAHGRILTRADGSVSEIPLDARGVLFVQAGDRSTAVVR